MVISLGPTYTRDTDLFLGTSRSHVTFTALMEADISSKIQISVFCDINSM